MQIEPIGDKVLVKPKSPEEKTKNGIVLARKEEEKQDTGTIESIGNGENVKNFKVGDTIIYQKYGPANIEIDKKTFVIVNLDEILAIIKEEN